ncbi:AbrB/MazE/SpoVT family DNA-binding domain-containing protein [Paenibacillus xanthanilyticus]|uniref:AbrB/MazE/SpoVT family DNA-binding domain-containing protein n=1 Tax=Paenibacillus xanthanilyticus TaxID=1783531 RepID=A0ABV8KA15_9BACL
MKATGVVRKVDELGRVVIPVELRRTLDIKEGESLEIFVNGEQIMLKKYAPGCTFCGKVEISTTLAGKHVCSGCRDTLVRG